MQSTGDVGDGILEAIVPKQTPDGAWLLADVHVCPQAEPLMLRAGRATHNSDAQKVGSAQDRSERGTELFQEVWLFVMGWPTEVTLEG